MAFIRERSVDDYNYRYLAKSVRLPDGRVKSIQKIINEEGSAEELEKKYLDYFISEEKRLHAEYAAEKYGLDSIYTKQQIEKIEGVKVEYAYIMKRFSPEQKRDVFDRFTANYTYESNALEGNSLTLKDVSMVLFEKRSIEGKDLREIYETRNSRKVMDKVIGKEYGVNGEDILRLHKDLMKDIDARTGYKKIPNYILGSNIKLTPPEKVVAEMEKLIQDYQTKKETNHPLKLAAEFHGRFEKIHPFEDGNGRVGRFLINIMLQENKYPPIIIRKTQRESYLKALQDFDRGYKINLQRLILDKYKKTYKDFFETYVKYM
jgi:Fic family protein